MNNTELVLQLVKNGELTNPNSDAVISLTYDDFNLETDTLSGDDINYSNIMDYLNRYQGVHFEVQVNNVWYEAKIILSDIGMSGFLVYNEGYGILHPLSDGQEASEYDMTALRISYFKEFLPQQ